MSTKKEWTISFADKAYAPLTLKEGAELPEHLTPENSPVLFGCRSGICGTCLVEVVEGGENLSPPKPHEVETLSQFAPDYPKARLTCQLKLTGPIKLKLIEY